MRLGFKGPALPVIAVLAIMGGLLVTWLCVMVYTGKRWAIEEFDPAIRVLTGFVDRVPQHLWANWRSLSKGTPDARP